MAQCWRTVVGMLLALSMPGILSACGTPDSLQHTAGAPTIRPTPGADSPTALPTPDVRTIIVPTSAPASSTTSLPIVPAIGAGAPPSASACPTGAAAAALENPQPVVSDLYVADTSLQQTVSDSPIIVVATLQSMGGTVNMSLDINDSNKIASNDFALGQLYQLAVQQYLHGHGPTTITVGQIEAELPASEACITPSEIAKARAVYRYYPFLPHATYLLFLAPMRGFDPRLGYLEGTRGPWRFRLHPDGSATMEDVPGVTELVPATFWPAGHRPVLDQVMHE